MILPLSFDLAKGLLILFIFSKKKKNPTFCFIESLLFLFFGFFLLRHYHLYWYCYFCLYTSLGFDFFLFFPHTLRFIIKLFVEIYEVFLYCSRFFRAINIHLRSDFILPLRFGYVMFLFSFSLRKFLFLSWFLQWPIHHSIACCGFIYFPLEISSFISCGQKNYKTILHLLRLTLCPKICSILGEFHYMCLSGIFCILGWVCNCGISAF